MNSIKSKIIPVGTEGGKVRVSIHFSRKWKYPYYIMIRPKQFSYGLGRFVWHTGFSYKYYNSEPALVKFNKLIKDKALQTKLVFNR